MRHFIDGCGKRFVDNGMGFMPAPLGAVISVASTGPAVARVISEGVEVPSACPPGAITFPAPGKGGAYLPSCAAEGKTTTILPDGRQCYWPCAGGKTPSAVPVVQRQDICQALWAINQDAMAAIQDAITFHVNADPAQGMALVIRAIDSVIQGGEFTVDYFPSKAMVRAFLLSTQAGGAGIPPRMPARLYATCSSPVR